MKLYDSIGPNPRVVRMFAAEKGIDLPKVTVDLMGGENRQAPYVSRVPTGGLPMLETDDGHSLAEVTVICDYLEELHPTPALIGTTPWERAEARMWTRRIDQHYVEPMVAGFRAAEGRGLFQSRMPLVSEAAAAELKHLGAVKLAWLDEMFAGNDWVCGNRFTIADILLFAFVDFGAQVGQPLPDGVRWLPGWRDRVAARPSAAA